MKRRLTLLAATLGLFGLLLTSTAAQAGSLQQDISGSFTDTAIDTNSDGMAANIFTGGTKGTGGAASFDGVVEIAFVESPTGVCGDNIEADVVAYSIVRRFASGSLMFSRLIDGHACFNPGAGTATIDINAEVFGGTGKFAGASGAYSVHFDVSALLPDGQGGLAHAAFDGKATGTLD